MSNFTGHAKPQEKETPAPNLVVMRDRIIIQEHHHGEINRYIWDGSNIADHYSKVCLDFDNNVGECGVGIKDERDNHRP